MGRIRAEGASNDVIPPPMVPNILFETLPNYWAVAQPPRLPPLPLGSITSETRAKTTAVGTLLRVASSLPGSSIVDRTSEALSQREKRNE